MSDTLKFTEERNGQSINLNMITHADHVETDQGINLTECLDKMKDDIEDHKSSGDHDERYYTQAEVDNKFSVLETNIDWKESVATFADIETAYPSPDDGWTVNVKDTNYTYRWTGDEWVAISANSIPLATKEVSGKMSTSQVEELEDATDKKHVHGNMDVLSLITKEAMDTWGGGTDTAHSHPNKSVLDKITEAKMAKLDGVEDGANKYTHPNSGVAAGAYQSVVVDARGHVTSGNNPTSLSGYGITDAYAKSEIDIKFTAVEGRIPAASSSTPKEDGAASAGTSLVWARGDHVHPARQLSGVTAKIGADIITSAANIAVSLTAMAKAGSKLAVSEKAITVSGVGCLEISGAFIFKDNSPGTVKSITIQLMSGSTISKTLKIPANTVMPPVLIDGTSITSINIITNAVWTGITMPTDCYITVKQV